VIPAEDGRRIGQYLAAKLGGVPSTPEAIAAVPVERLHTAQTELKADLPILLLLYMLIFTGLVEEVG
jgi:hypothetical protein